MSVPLFENLSTVATRLFTSPRRLLGLAYDGTLTPLVGHPCDAILTPSMRETLESFVDRPRWTTAIVSGRGLDDLRFMIGIDRLIYGANHGLEICGPGMEYLDTVAVEKQAMLTRLAQQLFVKLHSIAGVIVENKGLTLSVHYRMVNPHTIPFVRRIVEHAVANDSQTLYLTHGAMVFEIRPTITWNKGNAVDWIRSKTCEQHPLTIYIGDDLTDEDAFVALPSDITIKVGGNSQTTDARYHVEDTEGVGTFLRWLDRISRFDY